MSTRSQVIRDILDGFVEANGEVAAKVAEPIAQFLSMLVVLPFVPFVVKARRDDERAVEAHTAGLALSTSHRAVVDNDEVW